MKNVIVFRYHIRVYASDGFDELNVFLIEQKSLRYFVTVFGKY